MSSATRPGELSIREALQAAMAHHDAGRLAEAEAIYRQVLESFPDRPEALVLLADVAQRAGRGDEAIALLARAVRVQPGYAPALTNLAAALEAEGRQAEALGAWRTALSRAEGPAARAGFARCVAAGAPLARDAGFRALLARAIREAWARPADLARAAIALLRADPAAREPFTPAAFASFARDELLLALLENAQACDASFERFLAAARGALVAAAEDDPEPFAGGLAFACALARQCFLGDYVVPRAEHEVQGAERLRASLASALQDGRDVAPLAAAAVASQFPLATVAGIERLAARSPPEPLRALLAQQVDEPRDERELVGAIAQLTAIGAGVSSAVRRQYEESPYPRWVRLPPAQPLPLAAHLAQLFPLERAPLVPDRPLDILVAGCGTGQESLDIARRFPGSRVLAIDLSRASLAYAARKARELGVANVQHAQADILALDALGRDFDVISSVGVLHHLADPLEGWRKLAARLRPGGFMQVGLYSEVARRDIVAARGFIAQRGFAADAAGIRSAREALLAEPRFAAVTALRDFHGLNECRDLLFHVEEHRFTLPQVRDALASLCLELVGLVVPPAVRRAYARRFPQDRPQADLDGWDAYEREHPDTFAGMYLFWARKGSGA